MLDLIRLVTLSSVCIAIKAMCALVTTHYYDVDYICMYNAAVLALKFSGGRAGKTFGSKLAQLLLDLRWKRAVKSIKPGCNGSESVDRDTAGLTVW